MRACALGGYITTLKTSGSKRKELHDLGFLDKQIPKWVAPLKRVSVAGAGAGSTAEQAQRAQHAPPAAIPVGTPAIEQGGGGGKPVVHALPAQDASTNLTRAHTLR